MEGTIGQILRSDKLNIPGFTDQGPFKLGTTLGDVLSSLFNIVLLLAVVLAFFWLIWGAFHYIFAGGDKEQLSKARAKITWAIVGLIMTALAFLVSQLAVQILNPKFGTPLG